MTKMVNLDAYVGRSVCECVNDYILTTNYGDDFFSKMNSFSDLM